MPKLTVNRVLVMVLLAGLPSAFANSTPGAGDTQPPDLSVELGHADFLTYCATCHGVGGKGDGTVAEFLTIDAADLTQLRKKNVGSL